jgi:hypothetical protein
MVRVGQGSDRSARYFGISDPFTPFWGRVHAGSFTFVLVARGSDPAARPAYDLGHRLVGRGASGARFRGGSGLRTARRSSAHWDTCRPSGRRTEVRPLPVDLYVFGADGHGRRDGRAAPGVPQWAGVELACESATTAAAATVPSASPSSAMPGPESSPARAARHSTRMSDPR